LQASGASPFTFCASAISTCQPVKFEPVVDEPHAVHRLDRRADRLPATFEPLRQTVKPICVRWRRADLGRRALTIEQVEGETLATEIQTRVQHEVGPPLDSSQDDKLEPVIREALLHGIPYNVGKACRLVGRFELPALFFVELRGLATLLDLCFERTRAALRSPAPVPKACL
jgi:hypothetical protein